MCVCVCAGSGNHKDKQSPRCGAPILGVASARPWSRGGVPPRWLWPEEEDTGDVGPDDSRIFIFLLKAATQLARQVQQVRTLVVCSIKVGLGISRTHAVSQWNPVYNAFNRFFCCANKTIRQ